jgi:Beta-galactosidase
MRIHTLRRPSRTHSLALLVVALMAAVAGGAACGSAHGVPAGDASAAKAVVAVHSPLIVGLADGAGGDGGASTGPALSQMKTKSGASYFRDAFYWNKIEPRRGHFDFRYYDHYMLALGRRHMHTVPQVVGAPKWAAPSFWAVPTNPGPFADFVAALMHRYGVGGTFWKIHPGLKGSAITAVELLNEPYFSNGNAGVYDPGRYDRLVRATAIATRHVDRHVSLLLEADMATHESTGRFTWWVDAMYRAMPSLNRYFDGVAMHAYGNDAKHLTPIRAGQPYQNFDRTRRIEDVRAQFVRHHAASKPFWIMETGYSTCHLHLVDCVSEKAQAADLRTELGYIQGRYRTWVQAVFVYGFQDANRGIGLLDAYGLLRSNGSPKPAMSVFKPLARKYG